jgi:hypothetical protein
VVRSTILGHGEVKVVLPAGTGAGAVSQSAPVLPSRGQSEAGKRRGRGEREMAETQVAVPVGIPSPTLDVISVGFGRTSAHSLREVFRRFGY